VSDSGTYTVQVVRGACSDSDDIYVSLNDVPSKPFLGPDTTLCEDSVLVLDASTAQNVTYQWQDLSTRPTFTVERPGLYYVTYYNECGQAEDSIVVDFINCNCPIFVANAFTPNRDNLNDDFKPVVACPLIDYEFQIFDRWGKLIWVSRDINMGWDGRFGGADVTEGTYVWVMYFRYLNNPQLELDMINGSVMVIR
jgi:gliding motility-associated-like protein